MTEPTAAERAETEQVFAAYKQGAASLLRNPDDAKALLNQSILLTARGHSRNMPVVLAERCAALAPDNPDAVMALGTALLRADRFEEAIRVLHRASEIARPEYRHAALCHLALAHYCDGKPEWAIAWYDKAIAANPDAMEPRVGRAYAMLASGDLRHGMYEYECMYYKRTNPRPIMNCELPRWLGEPLDKKHIVVAHDQGYGDTIQFIRYLERLKAGKITVAMPPALQELIRPLTPHPIISDKGPFDADYYATPMSLCGAIGFDYSDVSGKPYISAEPIKLPPRGNLKVGIAWSKGRIQVEHHALAHDVFNAHTMDLETFSPIFAVPGVSFYSLQVGESDEIMRAGLDGFLGDLTVFIKDWADTARCIAAMDAVVSVCTGTVHLAGAMGKPTFVMTPYTRCWRWLRGRKDTPWYDSVTLASQERPGDWSGPIEKAKQWLSRLSTTA